jgi:hypothetical protein
MNKKNVIVGAALIALGPAGLNRPATITRALVRSSANGSTSGTGTAISDWKEVGYTQDGLEVSTDPSYGEVEVDQLMDAAMIFKDGMSMSISTTFAEATLENLMISWGQAGSTLTSTASTAQIDIVGGSLGDAPIERGLLAVGNAPRKADGTYGERFYHAYRVLSVEGSAHSLSRADATVIPVTFRALPEDSNGNYGVVRETLV